MKRRLLLLWTFLIALGACVAQAQQTYPNRPIRIIVPFSPGSGSDITARFYAEKMAPLLGQPIVVENKPGADGAIGMEAAKAAPADGYTIVQSSISPSMMNVVTMPNLKYDPVRDFKILHAYTWGMNALVVKPSSPIKSFDELKQLGKTKEITVGTWSTTQSLAITRLANAAGIQFQIIPYKGPGQVLTDLLGGVIDLAVVDTAGSSSILKDQTVRAILVTGGRRSSIVPNVPTAIEAGVPNYIVQGWNALFVRDETPEPIRIKLADAQKQVLNSKEGTAFFAASRDTFVQPTTPSEMRDMQNKDIQEYRKVAKDVAGLPVK